MAEISWRKDIEWDHGRADWHVDRQAAGCAEGQMGGRTDSGRTNGRACGRTAERADARAGTLARTRASGRVRGRANGRAGGRAHGRRRTGERTGARAGTGGRAPAAARARRTRKQARAAERARTGGRERVGREPHDEPTARNFKRRPHASQASCYDCHREDGPIHTVKQPQPRSIPAFPVHPQRRTHYQDGTCHTHRTAGWVADS